MAKGLKAHIKYAEELLNRPLTKFEKDLFEWAYVQGYEDSQEGVKKENPIWEEENHVS